MQLILSPLHHWGWWCCWEVEGGLPQDVTEFPLTAVGSLPRAVGFGITLVGCLIRVDAIPPPPLGLWFVRFLSIWESDSVKTPQKPICSKVESFPISICFLCKCMWWPWSHLNPCAHLTCSLVLFFWRIRSKIKSLFEDYWKGIPHVSVCVHTGHLF